MSRKWLTTMVAAAALLAVVAAVWQSHRATQIHSSALSVIAEKDALRERAEKAEKENAALRSLAGMPPAAETPPHHDHPGGKPSAAATDPESVRLAAGLQDKLKEAAATITELETRIGTLEEKLKKTSDENQRLAAEAQELRERVDSTVRLVDALQTEMKSRNERLLQLELANRNLRDQSATAGDRVARVQQVIRETEEINRRRENYLSTILRRIRELTDQFRAVGVRVENPQGAAPAVPGELSRIQTVLSLSEDDLKQIASLNAQAARVQAKLPK